ncbi:PHP domain-containing protein [Kytococcus sp. HMSC28H12]|uniref:PHP domain-containing protein n=1 Tax=Kytococcus sp. HMSC28H12 TaxID=1581067 RepID=UPI0008A524CE|nr:PHP domain-containing protein [Kytococcus sp. HMSC28H12]OFS12962.1 hypothetical protein HMPREF3099_06895 [Kytococcus sp. HMSC28H12]
MSSPPPDLPTAPRARALACLREVAFLNERAQQSSRRIEAYRNAVTVVEGLSEEEFARHTEADSWQELRGIGSSTAAVVREAVAGEVPTKLAAAREEHGGPLLEMTPAGRELLGLLAGDLHSHTSDSDGGSPLLEMARAADALGRDYLAVTDHSPRLRVANGLSAERLVAQRDTVAQVRQQLADEGRSLELLHGIEVDVLDDGTLDQREDLLATLDVRVASVHSKLRMPSAEMTPRMLAAVRNPLTSVLGHCTGRLVTGGRGTRPPSEFDAEAVFAACAQECVAVELNARPERQDPPDELIALALEAGCLFSIDSDAHAPGQLDLLAFGAQRAADAGIPPERIVTTWPATQVKEWAAARL